MTLIATRSLDHIASVRHLGAVGHEVEGSAGVVVGQTKCRQDAGSVNTDSLRRRRIESCGRLCLEYILVGAVAQNSEGSAGIRTRLTGGGDHRPSGHPGSIGSILLLPIG